jgi:putative tryptophan/tyrosine transport system substrate-binding protein
MIRGSTQQALDKSKNLRLVVCALCALLFALCSVAQAQPKKIPRIGFLSVTSPSTIPARIDAFRQSLRDLGYEDGKTIKIEFRYAEGKLDLVRELAAELIALNVDVIVSGGSAATRPARDATSTVPIVMAQDTDPVRNGFVASLARPGGNITGLSILAPELSGKQLEILKEIVPKLSRVALFGNSAEPGNAQLRKETELTANMLRVQVQYLEVQSPKDVENAFKEAIKQRADVVLVPSMPITNSRRAQITDLALKSRLPTLYGQPEYVDVGGLIFYGASITELFRRAAVYVDKILKGAKPADLPVEQPTKFEFMINLKTAKQIGVSIPPNVLARADRVIR